MRNKTDIGLSNNIQLEWNRANFASITGGGVFFVSNTTAAHCILSFRKYRVEAVAMFPEGT